MKLNKEKKRLTKIGKHKKTRKKYKKGDSERQENHAKEICIRKKRKKNEKIDMKTQEKKGEERGRMD